MARLSSRDVLTRLFFASTVGLVLLFLVMMARELNPEWGRYQITYAKLAAEKAGKRPPLWTPLEVKQIYLPQLGRTDRCTTCHLGVDNPKMADAPQPFRTHPNYQQHPFEDYGCTVCHGGQGMAVTKKDAHGFVKHWEQPLLPNAVLPASCTSCHDNWRQLPGTERLVRAQQLFDRLGCIGCHAVHGKGGPISTDLATVAYKGLDEFDFRYVHGPHTAVAWNVEHFKNPQAVNPGDPAANVPPSAMPNYQLTDEDAMDLTALVFSYWREDRPAKYRVPGDPAAATSPAGGKSMSAVERGRAAFQKYGCVGCHGVEGRGGMKNYNASTGDEVPPLTYVAHGFTKDQLKALIHDGRYPTKADPKGPTPPLWMPAWKDKLSAEEIDDVAEYLMSLYPADTGAPAASSTGQGGV